MYKINFLSSFLLWRRHFSNSIFIWCCLMQKFFPESEFIEFKPRLKSAKYLFLLSASLNFITLNTILSGTNHIKPSLKLGRGSNSLKSASALIYFKIKSAGRLQIADCRTFAMRWFIFLNFSKYQWMQSNFIFINKVCYKSNYL